MNRMGSRGFRCRRHRFADLVCYVGVMGADGGWGPSSIYTARLELRAALITPVTAPGAAARRGMHYGCSTPIGRSASRRPAHAADDRRRRIEPGMEVLDVGCARAPACVLAESWREGHRITTARPGSSRRARAAAPPLGAGHVEQRDGGQRFPAESFERAWCSSHTPDARPRAAVQECARILRPRCCLWTSCSDVRWTSPRCAAAQAADAAGECLATPG